MSPLPSCPKCHFRRQPEARECPRCGIVFARWKGGEGGTSAEPRAQGPQAGRVRSHDSEDPFHWLEEGEAPPPPPEAPVLNWPKAHRGSEQLAQPPVPPWGQDRDFAAAVQADGAHKHLSPRQAALLNRLGTSGPGFDATIRDLKPEQMAELLNADKSPYQSVWIGAVLGLIFYGFTLTRFFFGTIVTLVHEMGHAFFYWVSGKVAIPAFDFIQGGGVTMGYPRNNLLFLVILGLISYPFYLNRTQPNMLRHWGMLMVVYCGVVLSPLDELLISGGGHFFELAWATLCFYRCLSGRDLKTPIERPLYALIGSFTVAKVVGLGTKLMWSSSFRAEYSQAKPGMVMDLDYLAAALHLNVSVVGGLFALSSLAVLPCAIALSKDEVRARLKGRVLRFAGFA